MPKFKLTYFDFDGGRGEPARLALHLGGTEFEDRRVGFQEWDALRDQMPFQALPVLDVDGRLVAQSMLVRWLRGGALDYVATDLTDRVAPLLVQHAERLAAQPKIAAYYAARKK